MLRRTAIRAPTETSDRTPQPQTWRNVASAGSSWRVPEGRGTRTDAIRNVLLVFSWLMHADDSCGRQSVPRALRHAVRTHDQLLPDQDEPDHDEPDQLLPDQASVPDQAMAFSLACTQAAGCHTLPVTVISPTSCVPPIVT